MSDYISRKDAKNYVIGRYDDQLGFITMEDIIDQLDYVPAADVRPVVRGEWLEFVGSAYHGVDDDGEVKWRDVSIFHCDKCGRKTVVKENFCPNCGADMREEATP